MVQRICSSTLRGIMNMLHHQFGVYRIGYTTLHGKNDLLYHPSWYKESVIQPCMVQQICYTTIVVVDVVAVVLFGIAVAY